MRKLTVALRVHFRVCVRVESAEQNKQTEQTRGYGESILRVTSARGFGGVSEKGGRDQEGQTVTGTASSARGATAV